jgi:hypothetical protein
MHGQQNIKKQKTTNVNDEKFNIFPISGVSNVKLSDAKRSVFVT